jgi:stage V sporulation protein AD
MSSKRLGKQTVKLQAPPSIVATASIVGTKEGQGPLRNYFDNIVEDEFWGEKSWEKAESKFLKETINLAISNANKSASDINYIIAGDLLNQCISSSYGLRESEVPFYGVYGACSTMAESMSLGAMLIDGGFADYITAGTASHFCAAEKQFRYPLELGTQRPLTSQWTVTGSGAAILSSTGTGPYITHITTGKIIDMGIKDSNNMGAAMAPAAADTIYTHFQDTGMIPSDYDLIVTGDLGYVGMEITDELLTKLNCKITNQLSDCGIMIFNRDKQDTHAGGSGCGCSASVFSGYLYKEILSGKFNKILFVATGALMSPTSIQQSESIPSIAHAVTIQKTL